MRRFRSLILLVWPTVIMLILTWIAWSDLPNTVPIHLNNQGHADSFAPRGNIWLFPGLALFILLILRAVVMRLPGSDPHPNQSAVDHISFGVGLFLVCEHTRILTDSMNNIWSQPPWLFLGMSMFMLFLGSGIIRTKQDPTYNSWPWNHLSDQNQEKANRFMGRNLMISAVVLLLLSTIWPDSALAFTVLLANFVVGFVYALQKIRA